MDKRPDLVCGYRVMLYSGRRNGGPIDRHKAAETAGQINFGKRRFQLLSSPTQQGDYVVPRTQFCRRIMRGETLRRPGAACRRPYRAWKFHSLYPESLGPESLGPE